MLQTRKLVSSFLISAFALPTLGLANSTNDIATEHSAAFESQYPSIQALLFKWDQYSALIETFETSNVPDPQFQLAKLVAKKVKAIQIQFEAGNYAEAEKLHSELNVFIEAKKTSFIKGFSTIEDVNEVIASYSVGENGNPQADWVQVAIFVAAEVYINVDELPPEAETDPIVKPRPELGPKIITTPN